MEQKIKLHFYNNLIYWGNRIWKLQTIQWIQHQTN